MGDALCSCPLERHSHVERPFCCRVSELGPSEWWFPVRDALGNASADVQLVQPLVQRAAKGLAAGEGHFREILDALPAAVYVTDPAGQITYYNEAAAALWGHRPEIGKSQWCGSWKLYTAEGTPLAHEQCPMAIALREKQVVRGIELIAERPDGSRIPLMPYPTLLYDALGALLGAVNMLVDLTGHKRAEDYAQQLASIIESSDDAIISKDLNGIITSWNRGAERIFGYTAQEAIGQPLTILIPPAYVNEEPGILERIRSGERIEHYETVRRHKDGRRVDISLTVSPVKNEEGRIVGASKIARNFTDRRLAEERQQLLLREMDHRVKNLFALSRSVVTLSARTATTPTELASDVRQRLAALARAHALTLPKSSGVERRDEQSATLHALIQIIIAPYNEQAGQIPARIVVHGPDVTLAAGSVTSFALLLHEFATNAAKHGALATPTGRIDIDCSQDGDQFVLKWTERGGPPIESTRGSDGFGSMLARATVEDQLGGSISREWRPGGLRIRLSIARDRIAI
jgi:PAS domain S-box-containing protein